MKLPRALVFVLAAAVASSGCMLGATAAVETDRMRNGEREKQFTAFAIMGSIFAGTFLISMAIYVAVKDPESLARGMSAAGRFHAQETKRRRAEDRARERDRQRTFERHRDNNPYYDRVPPPREQARQRTQRTPREPTRAQPTTPTPTTPPSQTWNIPNAGSITYPESSQSGGKTAAGAASKTAGAGSASGPSEADAGARTGSRDTAAGTGGRDNSGRTNDATTKTGSASSNKRKWVVHSYLTLAQTIDWSFPSYPERGTAESLAKYNAKTRLRKVCHEEFDGAQLVPAKIAYGQLDCVQGGSDGKEWKCRYPRAIGYCEKGVME